MGRNNYLDPSTLLFSFISGYLGIRGEYLGRRGVIGEDVRDCYNLKIARYDPLNL
jgi:hypothetical protein